jgi:predicted restriction endonuclease
MPSFACPACGAITSQRHCPAHAPDPNAHRSPNRDRAKQARFRKQVLTRAGHRCQYIEGVARCPVHGGRNLRACHIVPLSEGGSYQPTNGRALCRAHDMETDPYAR